MFISCISFSVTDTGVSYKAKRSGDTTRDDSFPVFSDLYITGNITNDILIKPVITDISGTFRYRKYKKQDEYKPSNNELYLKGELVKHGWVNTSEFSYVFLLGQETDYYSYEGIVAICQYILTYSGSRLYRCC